jgi:hypothetical protein
VIKQNKLGASAEQAKKQNSQQNPLHKAHAGNLLIHWSRCSDSFRFAATYS